VICLAVLGPVRTTVRGDSVSITAPMQRAVLACLAMARNGAMSMEELVDALWASPPNRTVNLVQQYVSALRRALGADAITTTGHGYQLVLEQGGVDAHELRRLLTESIEARQTGEPARAAQLVSQALALDRGTPLSDLPDSPFVEPARAMLEQTMLEAKILSVTLAIDRGHFADGLAQAQLLLASHPLDERIAVEQMRALTGAGRQADALAVYATVRDTLLDELGMEPGPGLRQAQTAVLNQDPMFVPIPEAFTGWDWLPDSVPNPSTPLLGRAEDVELAERSLAQEGTRLVTIVGSGGVGKTRLAVELSRRAQEQGRLVAFVKLDRADSPGQVLAEIAAVLRIKEAGDTSLSAGVARAVNGSRILLVLDNMEHVLAAGTDVADLLAPSADLRVLATSREALRLQGEHLVRLGPLELGAESPATQLFWQRAGAAAPSVFAEIGDQQEAATAICQRLDGLPLAIELAAARVAVMPPSTILERLNHGPGLLSAGSRDAPNRQRSLEACLQWSVGLLSEEERRFFAAMSVFVGGSSLEAAEGLATAILGDCEAIQLVDSLVAKSLLATSLRHDGVRLGMLETIRQHASGMLARSDADRLTAVGTLTEHVTGLFCSDLSICWWPPRTAQETEDLREEVPNAREALARLTDRQTDPGWIDLEFGLCRVLGHLGAFTEMGNRLAPLLGRTDLSPSRRVDLLFHASWAMVGMGDYPSIEKMVREALALLADHPNDVQEAILRVGLSEFHYTLGERSLAGESWTIARRAAERSGDPEVIAFVDAYAGLDGNRVDGIPAMLAALSTARLHRNQVFESRRAHHAQRVCLRIRGPRAQCRRRCLGDGGFRSRDASRTSGRRRHGPDQCRGGEPPRRR
jgi:predicted ATPase/DNA-binding SARP family transcriptional activator